MTLQERISTLINSGEVDNVILGHNLMQALTMQELLDFFKANDSGRASGNWRIGALREYSAQFTIVVDSELVKNSVMTIYENFAIYQGHFCTLFLKDGL